MVEHLYCCHILMFHSLCNHVTFVSVLCFSCPVFFVFSLSSIYRFLCESIATFKFTAILPWRKTVEITFPVITSPKYCSFLLQLRFGKLKKLRLKIKKILRTKSASMFTSFFYMLISMFYLQNHVTQWPTYY